MTGKDCWSFWWNNNSLKIINLNNYYYLISREQEVELILQYLKIFRIHFGLPLFSHKSQSNVIWCPVQRNVSRPWALARGTWARAEAGVITELCSSERLRFLLGLRGAPRKSTAFNSHTEQLCCVFVERDGVAMVTTQSKWDFSFY